MPKIIPTCPSRPDRVAKNDEEHSYEISLLTPMFGGGVDAGEPDLRMPFRATAIRGQLQFWWRATVGANCRDVAELREKHAAVWGNTGKPSEVKLVVEPCQPADARPCGAYIPTGAGRWRFRWDADFRGGQGIPYALFPFAGKPPAHGNNQPAEPPARFIRAGEFALRLIYPSKFRDEVHAALRAWVNFGGMGARARRGCGSIYCKQLAPKNLAEAAALVNELLPNPPERTREWPTLGGPLLVGNESDALKAWASAVGALQKFRQGERFARNGGRDGRPGRSLWPEPETVRRITNQRMARHERMENIPNDAFPRAELGLPIIFHFKDAGDGDPADTTLYPLVGGEKCDRMASPLIIKAMGLENGGAVPIVLRLRTPQLEKVQLKDAGKPPEYGPEELRGGRLAKYEKSPMADTPSGSALDAFINFIQDEDVWGVLQ
ncbi:MAG: type III-B CRISPR module RAMP protein Cmr1 [Phycisphaerae bacterium]